MVNGIRSEKRYEEMFPKYNWKFVGFYLEEEHFFLRVMSKRGKFHEDLDTFINGLKKIQKFNIYPLSCALLIHGTGRQKYPRLVKYVDNANIILCLESNSSLSQIIAN